MLKKISEKMNEYVVIANNLSYLSKEWESKCYFCGYVDGYFDEDVYKPYIENALNNENKLVKYGEGFVRGSRDRKTMKDNNPKGLLKEKEIFLKKLALNDSLNNVETRNLKPDSYDVYNFYKSGTFNLNNMDFEEKYIPKKR